MDGSTTTDHKTTIMTPTKATIRSYQVGFGDCYLLTFHYAGTTGDRHVLIDCGSTRTPNRRTGDLRDARPLLPIVKDIGLRTGGKLHAVVATHRHKDHISGFTTTGKADGTGDVLRALKPDLVVQPWTEDPALPENARKPKAARTASGTHALGLQSMHAFSAAVVKEVKGLRKDLGVQLQGQLAFLGEDNVSNLNAVKNLMTMGKKNEYLHYGKKTALEKVLPGVKVHVLGPPTLEQYPAIGKQRGTDAAEFWLKRGAAASAYVAQAASPFAPQHRLPEAEFPQEVRWIVPRIRASRGAQLLEMVTILDGQMNNTSLILLFEFGGKKLLFPGDAQIENWEHALGHKKDGKKNRALLAATDLYKVGHHGSRNATPITLWNMFAKKGTNKGPLKTMMSTLSGVHGHTEETAVPRKTLVTALREHSKLSNTDGLTKKKFFVDEVITA